MYQDSKQVSKCNCSNMFLNRPLYFHKTTIDTWSSSLQFCQVIFTTSVNTIFRPRQNIEALKGVFGRRDSFWSKFKFDWDTGHMYVECRVTTESVPRKLAQYRVVMTAAEFWSHSAPAHMSSPETGESSYSQGANNISQKQYLDMVPYSTLLKAAYIVFTLTNV